MRESGIVSRTRALLMAVSIGIILGIYPVGLSGLPTGAYAQETGPGDRNSEGTGPRSFAAIGAISNVQMDESGPVWVLSGAWKLRTSITNEENATASFLATIRMVAMDGTSTHMHRIYDFTLSSWSLDNTTKTFNGTSTITLRNGPQENIPVSITIKNGGLISLTVDSEVVDHFGASPIYGTVVRVFDHTGVDVMRGGQLEGQPRGSPVNATRVQLEGLARTEVGYYPNSTGYLVHPENASALPSVVMIHEWWGLNQNIKNEAEKLARDGYVVLAVDLYQGQVATESTQARELSTEVRNNPERAVENLNAAIDYVSSLPGVNSSRIASLGWCFGGGWSLQLALNSEQPLAATVIYYGNLVTDPETLSSITWPVLGIFGSADQSIPVETVNQFEAALNANNITNEIYVYEGLGHAFANPSGDNYAQEETADAWNKTLGFLKERV